MISFQRRHLLFSMRLGNPQFLPCRCWMGLKLSWRVWSLTYKKNSQERHSSSGACNHQDIFMVVSGIKMVVACPMSPLRKSRYELMMAHHTFVPSYQDFMYCFSIPILIMVHFKITPMIPKFSTPTFVNMILHMIEQVSSNFF